MINTVRELNDPTFNDSGHFDTRMNSSCVYVIHLTCMGYGGVIPDGDRVKVASLGVALLQVEAQPGESDHVARGSRDDPP